MPKVLIADKMSPRAEEIFKERGIDVDVITGLERDELIKIIGEYDGMAVRSSTKATPPVLEAAEIMKVIGRAGIGVDNIDLPTATAKGIVVMNTPFGNSITTAEHAIAMMFALARDIPAADASTQAGKWEKSRFMGVELTNKVLGIIGCGNIGTIVASRALGLRMRVVAFDPFLTPERAVEIGVEKAELDDVLARADFITLHTPLTDKTRDIIDAGALAKTKKGVHIINCARGGLVNEADLKAALDTGQVAGAALDVFETEPAKESFFFGMENVVCTPHLGAATSEAQENVAIQVAEQMADYLMTGAITNAINMASVTAEEAPLLKPYMRLGGLLGRFLGQLDTEGLTAVKLEFEGKAAGLNDQPILASALAGVLGPKMDSVNMVNAAALAHSHDIAVATVRHDRRCDYESLLRLTLSYKGGERMVCGTLVGGDKARLVEVQGISVESAFTENMLYLRNYDKPGFIGALGSMMGELGVNIATFHLGRKEAGGEAVALIEIDGSVTHDTLQSIRAMPQVVRADYLQFSA